MLVASILSAKNRHYILPLYPAMSLMIGLFMAETFQSDNGADTRGWNRRLSGWICAGIALMVFIVALAMPFANFFTGEIPGLSPVPCALFIIGSACSLAVVIIGARRYTPELTWSGLIISLVCALTFVYGYLEPELNTRNSHKNFLVQIRDTGLKRNSIIRMYKIENFQVTFYLHQNAPVLWTADDLKNFDRKIKSEG